MEKLGLNLGNLIGQILNFGIIMVVLVAWVYKPLMSMLQKRREKIEKGLEDAQVAADARANAEKDAEVLMTEAQAKAAQMIREATEKAECANQDVRAAAEAEMVALRKSGMAEIESEKERALNDLRVHVSALAIAAAERIIGETLDEKRQRVLVDEFFSGLKAGKVVILEGADLEGKEAEVTSALPLTEAEKKNVTDDVMKTLGSTAKVKFHIDPNILGGLILRVGDKVIDGSVINQMQTLRESLR